MFDYRRGEPMSEADWKAFRQEDDLNSSFIIGEARGRRSFEDLVHQVEIDEEAITGKPRQYFERETLPKNADLPMYEQMSQIVFYLGDFVSKNIRQRVPLRFHQEVHPPISITRLRTFLTSQARNMRHFADLEGDGASQDISRKTFYLRCAKTLDAFHTGLSRLTSADTVNESQHETLLSGLIQLRANIFEIAYDFETKRLEEQLNQEVAYYTEQYKGKEETVVVEPDPHTLLAQTLLRSQELQASGGVGLERTLDSVITALDCFQKKYKTWMPPEVGFHAATEPVQEVSGARVVLALAQAGQDLRSLFRSLEKRTALDLHFRLHTQNALTICDAMLLHLERHGLSDDVAASEVQNLFRHVAEARYSLSEIREHVQAYKQEVFTNKT